MNYRPILNKIIASIQEPDTHPSISSPETSWGMSATCDRIQKIALREGHPFVNMDGTLLLYTGDHWVEPGSYDLMVFLKTCFARINESDIKASIRSVVDGMVKQFPYTCLTPGVKTAESRINFANGELDLGARKPKLLDHSWRSYFRYILPYEYNPHARAPLFQRYLSRVLPDISTQNVLAEFLAWSLQPSLKLEKMAFLYGSGCNGKSVFTDIAEALMGPDNISHESLSDMCGREGDRSRSNIGGKILNICSDVSPDACSGDIFKRLASGEPVSSKLLYKDATIIRNYAKMLFCLNELPRTHDLSNGYFRRFLIIPFNVQIPKSEIDPLLAKKIIDSELPGIMNWVLRGRERLMRNGKFTYSEECEKVIRDYKLKMTEGKGGSKKKSLIILPPYL